MTQVFFSPSRFIPSILLKMMQNIGFQAVDMHFHTEYSMDGISDIRSVLARCRKKGYGVAVTDHNDIKGALKAWKLKTREFVVPGIEASTEEGVHALYYFYDIRDCRRFYEAEIKPLKKKNPFFLPTTMSKLMEKGHDHNAVITAAHPYGVGKVGIKKIKIEGGLRKARMKFQLAEGLNGSNMRKMNRKAITWAKYINKGMTAGSDGHMTKELGTALTLAYGYDVETFLNSVRKGHCVLLGKERNLFLTLIREARKEKNYFKRAYKSGRGWFWIKEHAADMETLRNKMRKYGELFHNNYMLHHLGLGKEDYEEYLKLGKNLFEQGKS